MLNFHYLKVNFFFFILLAICPSIIFAQSPKEKINSMISEMNSLRSLRAKISINNSINGTLSYQSPGNLHIKLSDGRVISANKTFLWVYSPSSAITGKQDLKPTSSGGLASFLAGYDNITQMGNTYKLKPNYNGGYEEIIVTIGPNNILKALKMKSRYNDSVTEISLSGVQTDIGLPASLFNFHPPSNAQMVENPLNQKE